MTQKSVLALSVGLTAFALAILAALIVYMGRPDATATADAAANLAPTPTTEAAGMVTDPQIQTLIDERETAYRQQLEQANQQLQQANSQLQEAYSKLQALSAQPAATQTALPEPTPEPPAPTAVVYAVSPEQAAAIALRVAPGASLTGQPGLVSFQGTDAYEVQFDSGMIYVDANSGKVLYNGTTPITTSRRASPLLGVEPGEHEGDDGAEGDDD